MEKLKLELDGHARLKVQATISPKKAYKSKMSSSYKVKAKKTELKQQKEKEVKSH